MGIEEEEGENVKVPQRDNVHIGGRWRWRCCTVGPGHTVLWRTMIQQQKKMTFTCEVHKYCSNVLRNALTTVIY